MAYNFFDKKQSISNSSGGAVTRALSEILIMRYESAIKSEIMSNQELAEELNKPIIRKFEKN